MIKITRLSVILIALSAVFLLAYRHSTTHSTSLVVIPESEQVVLTKQASNEAQPAGETDRAPIETQQPQEAFQSGFREC